MNQLTIKKILNKQLYSISENGPIWHNDIERFSSGRIVKYFDEILIAREKYTPTHGKTIFIHPDEIKFYEDNYKLESVFRYLTVEVPIVVKQSKSELF